MITHLEPDILECEVKWALGSITMNKASGDAGIPTELFQILKDDTVKVLHSICQQTWKIQQWPQDWKTSVLTFFSLVSFSFGSLVLGQPFPSPGDLPNPGIEPRLPALQADSLPAEPQGKPRYWSGQPIPSPNIHWWLDPTSSPSTLPRDQEVKLNVSTF